MSPENAMQDRYDGWDRLASAMQEDEDMRERRPSNIATLKSQLGIEPHEDLPFRIHRPRDNGR